MTDEQIILEFLKDGGVFDRMDELPDEECRELLLGLKRALTKDDGGFARGFGISPEELERLCAKIDDWDAKLDDEFFAKQQEEESQLQLDEARDRLVRQIERLESLGVPLDIVPFPTGDEPPK